MFGSSDFFSIAITLALPLLLLLYKERERERLTSELGERISRARAERRADEGLALLLLLLVRGVLLVGGRQGLGTAAATDGRHAFRELSAAEQPEQQDEQRDAADGAANANARHGGLG